MESDSGGKTQQVAMAKNNMSFRGGLWWLRHVTGLRALNKPYKAGVPAGHGRRLGKHPWFMHGSPRLAL